MSAHQVNIFIDSNEQPVTPGLVQGHHLLSLAGITAPKQLLLDVDGELDPPVAVDDWLLICGGERFSIWDGCPAIPDNPCLRRPLEFQFNGQPVAEQHRFHHAKVTGAELKRLDPHLRQDDGLYADLHGLADELIRDDMRLILQRRDCFITVPCGNVGYDIVLSQHLDEVQRQFPAASTQEATGQRYLLVPEVAVPEHFGGGSVTVLVLIPNGYPMASPDMFWVNRTLRLPDGRDPEGASHHEVHLGQTWQRFSWHYRDSQIAWRMGYSSLLTHMQFCLTRLAQPR